MRPSPRPRPPAAAPVARPKRAVSDGAIRDFTTLHRKTRTPVWLQISWRVLAVLALVAFAIFVHWLDRDGLRDNYDGKTSFWDIVYFTMISITTTGYGDIAPVSTKARLFDALIVTPIRVFAVLIFVGTAYNFVLRKTWDKWRMQKIQRTLRNHIIVAGYGDTGEAAATELVQRGVDPYDIVILDNSDARIQEAHAAGYTVLNGDATRDDLFEELRIRDARALIVTAGRDDTSVLIVLTARHLAPALPINVVIRAFDNEVLARQAGATNVINPVNFAGLLLAGSVGGEHIADYLTDLGSVQGRVQLVERPVAANEIGRPLRDLDGSLGVRIYRGGIPFGFWEPETARLEAGDVIVEIVPDGRLERDAGMGVT